jgi:hypothetical protein
MQHDAGEAQDRIAESKSDYFACFVNAHSEKEPEFE